jgi:hypothetical protein
MIDTRKLPGVKIKASAHIQNKGTEVYGYIDHNAVIGTVGKKKRLKLLCWKWKVWKERNCMFRYTFTKPGGVL